MSFFSSKVVVVTGAAGGIGSSLVKQFLDVGATVWGLDLNKEALDALADTHKKYGKNFFSKAVDVTSEAELRAAREEILQQSKDIHIWINNAGISGLGDFQSSTQSAFERVIQINLNAVVSGTRLALERMEHVGFGMIVNIASVAGHVAAPYLTAYCASKHAVVGFTRSLREELSLKQSPVKLFLVSPGFVDTKIIEKGKDYGYPEWLDFLLATPDKVASEIVKALAKGKLEIIPTINGKVIFGVSRFLPNFTANTSRILLSKSLTDLLLLRKNPPGSTKVDK